MSKKGKRQAEKAAPEPGGDGLTGVFSNDFPIYCSQNGLPPVTVRQLHRYDSTGNDMDLSFKHCVLVETETNTLKAIHIRNVLLEDRLLSALNSALEDSQLTAMILWNVGLNDVSGIIPLIKTCNVRRLVLDGNQLSSENVISLLQSTSLEHLSLKCCCLGDAFCAAINPVLAGNQTLLSLDLSSNHITDEGAEQLANVLRINRTILSLCLSGNRIGDNGVSELCKVLVRFPLTKDEEMKRKSLLATETSTESGLNSSGRSPSGVSLSGRGSRGSGGGGKGKKKDDKDRSGKSSVIGKAAKSSKVTGGKKGAVLKGEEKEGSQLLGQGVIICDPLVELVKEENDRLWMAGNTTLAHLTLSCNRIGERGVASLLDVLHTQRDSSVTSDLNDKTEFIGTGLLRVTLENNPIPTNNDQLIEITSWMRSHDPLLTTPTT